MTALEFADGQAPPRASRRPCGCLSRRGLLRGVAGCGLAAMPFAAGAEALDRPWRIDVHHHVMPPLFERIGTEQGLLNPAIRTLNLGRSLEEMDRNGVQRAVLSIPSPGAFGPPEQARRIARDANEYAARAAGDHKGRFGSFATLALPDVEGSVAEAAYALDVLKADGVQLWTSYGDFWLGDPRLDPLLEALNHFKAAVFVHPTAPDCCGHLVPEAPATMIEYSTDTARTIASLVLSGAASRRPEIRWIFAHAGGAMPVLLERFLLQGKAQSKTPAGAAKIPNGVLYELKRFHYETAQSANPSALGPLVRIAPASNILFGTDFPYREIGENIAGLASCGLFDAAGLRQIERDNALRLLARPG